ncbi:hypothetical protein ccbrp13_30180 [Ktedonobacteria bacterium brp13]|nr:hypothetical protein ccbrp13_30180 [Ktedonobacteria bacterium brp13]
MLQEYEVSLRFVNEQKALTTFILEPWGEIYTMEPDVTWLLTLQSAIAPVGSNAIEVMYSINCITVYGWEGCTATLYQDGEEVPKDMTGTRGRVPKTPDGVVDSLISE